MGILPIEVDILPPCDDRIFKLLLTAPDAKPALMSLLSAILGRKVVDVVVHANEVPNSDVTEKGERFDVNCKIDDGSQVNLEMQLHNMPEYRDGQRKNTKWRGVYYLTDLHSSQASKGLPRYDNLVRTYQVTFCAYNVFPHLPGFVNSFSLRHDETNELLCDAIQIIFVELSKLEEIVKKPVSEMTDLEKWSVFFRYAQDPSYRATVNEVIESEEGLQVAGEMLMSISKNETERAIFRSRKKYEWDAVASMKVEMDEAREEGRVEGRAEGRAEGIAIGEERGVKLGEKRGRNVRNREIAQNLIKLGLPLDQIIIATGIAREEAEQLSHIPN